MGVGEGMGVWFYVDAHKNNLTKTFITFEKWSFYDNRQL